MAECHPVGFQWVMEAKARSGTCRSASALVRVNRGSDITFLGGIVNYILQNEKYFREYVVAYTNAGLASAADPKYTVVPQRERREARQRERARAPGQEQAGAAGRARAGPRGGAIA